jgi:DNA repair protein RecN (Recombination protein N)
VTLLSTARQALEAAAAHDPLLAALAGRVSEAAYLVSDVAAELASYAQGIEADPARLGAVQERRAELARLIRTYGAATAVPVTSSAAAAAASSALAPSSGPADPGVPAVASGPAAAGTGAAGESAAAAVSAGGDLAAVLAWAKLASTRLLELDGDDETIAALAGEEEALAGQLRQLADKLSGARREAAQRFGTEVTAELTALAMPHARLSAVVTPLDQLGPNGGDEVEIRLAAHPGAPALPLNKGASGGELSRVMLAIEVVFAGADPVPTFVFDEVDAGVGGKAAVEVGRRLARLARLAQVIVVTHLPQVAAFADTHLVVEKAGDGSVTSSGISRLDDDGRVRELSRMLAGLEDSEFGRAHASELLAAAAAERGRMPEKT